MFTVRTTGGVALFLFGTTFLWLTPAFAGPGVSSSGALWGVTQAMSLFTMAGFTVATWGLFTRSSWWEMIAIASALLGALVLVPYWLAAHSAGEATPWFNVLVHVIGDAGVLILLTVPALELWVQGHVARGA
jgi:hypothetical protein